MLREPADLDGLILPAAQPERAWTAALGLRSCALAAADSVEAMASASTQPAGWSGAAAQEYRDRAAALTGRVAQTVAVAEQSAVAVGGWLVSAGDAVAAMRVARDAVQAAQQQLDSAQASGQYFTPAIDAELDQAWAGWRRARHAYWSSVDELAARLTRLRDGLSGHPWDAADNVGGFVTGLWRDAVEPLTWAWGVSGEALVDRDAWEHNVGDAPGQVWAGLTAPILHPVQTVSNAIDVDAWRQGRYGEGAAAVASIFIPTPKWLKLPEARGRAAFAANLADMWAPLPRLQTVEELLAGAELRNHEHAVYGHTVRRHVEVSHAYLMDRLTHGTLLDDGTRGFRPTQASVFVSLDVANRAVTEALRANKDAVRAYVASGSRQPLELRWRAAGVIGTVFERARGGFQIQDGNAVRVRLMNSPNGVFVDSAMVEP